MNIFDFLTEEAQSVGKRFHSVVDHYPPKADWSWDRTFDETKKDIMMLLEHLKKESFVESAIQDLDKVNEQISEAALQRQEIDNSVDHVLMIHVDEAGFKEGLKSIADKLDQHTNFCAHSYYPLLQQHMSPDQMQNIQDQLEFSLPG